MFSESRKSKAESRKPKVESRKPKVESRKSKVESRKSKVESRKSKVESRKSKVESRKYYGANSALSRGLQRISYNIRKYKYFTTKFVFLSKKNIIYTNPIFQCFRKEFFASKRFIRVEGFNTPPLCGVLKFLCEITWVLNPEYNHQSRTNKPRCSAAGFLISAVNQFSKRLTKVKYGSILEIK
jgi:hypothetical protein